MNALVLLAAGGSTRFPGEKLLYPIAGESLVAHTARRLLAAGEVEHRIAVVRPGATRLTRILEGVGISCVMCANADAGISASIATGVGALEPRTSRAVIALGDQPVPTAVIDALFRADADGEHGAVVPLYRGRRGNPVLFRSAMFPRLRALEGDAGARHLLAAMGAEVKRIETDLAVPPDLDCADDIPRMEEFLRDSPRPGKP